MQNLRSWLHHWLELPSLPQWGPCLSHPPASVPPPYLSSFVPFHTPPPTCSDVVDSSLPLPSHPPLLSSYLLSAFTLPSTPPLPTSTQPINSSSPHPQQTPRPPLNLRILQWNAGGLSPSRRAELIAFLSYNQYDLILLQRTHSLSTKKFQIPAYSTLRTDRTFARQGPVSSGDHNTGGGVLTLNHSDLAFSTVSVSSPSSQNPYSDYICAKLYSRPIRGFPSDFRTRTFSTDILPNSPDTFIHGDFSAHHPTWDSLISSNPPGNDLFRWITSYGLEILNDPASPTLLHHSTGSCSSPDISLAPTSLTPYCEWRTLPGLSSDHLPVEIVLPLSPVRHPNTCPPNSTTKSHISLSIDVNQSYIVEHLPSFDVGFVNIHQAARSFFLFLVEAAKASIAYGRLGCSPWALWSQKQNLQCRSDRGPALRHTGLRLTASDT